MNKAELNELCIKICEQDDHAAFTLLFDYLYQRLFIFAQKLTKQKELSEDIVADTFTKFWTTRKNLKIKNVLSYLYTSTYNMTQTQITQNYFYEQMISLEDISIDLAEYTCNPESELISKEELFKINSSIETLPPRCRMILFLTRESKLSYAEVALTLNISQKTVENQINIALKKIAKSLNIERDPERKKIVYGIYFSIIISL